MTRRREDSARRASTYKLLLGLPGVGLQALCGMLAQLTQGAAAVGMILVVHESTGSLAIAGGVTAGFSAGVCVARPAQGRLIDRRGAPPVLTACAVLHVGALIGLVAAAGSAAPAWALIQLGCLAGLGLPPVSTSMRVAWGRRMPGEGRTAAFSLVYLTQTMAILVGPLLLGALVALASASLALAAVAGVAGGGTLVFARLLRSPEHARPPAARAGVLGSPGILPLLAVTALLGGAVGALDVAMPALATARGVPAASGALAAAFSLGGVVGAIVYGTGRWRAEPARRLVALLGLLSLALAPLAIAPGLPALGGMLLVAGLPLNPALTTTSLLVDDRTPGAAEAFGWLSTAIGAGTAAGSAVAGVAAQRGGASSAFLAATLSAVAAAMLSWLMRSRL